MLTVIPFDLDNQKRCEPFILYISQAKTAIIHNQLTSGYVAFDL
jgi:hypothetical protein